MGNLQEELEIRMESVDLALKEAINLPEVQEYIKKSKDLLESKKKKMQFSINAYNNLLDRYISELDSLKETPNVKLFLGLLDNFNKLKDAMAVIDFKEKGITLN